MTNDDGFVFTDELVELSNQLWAVTAMIGAAFCGAVLIVIGIVATNPVSRQHLDRVSFRILVWALAANTIFGVANAIGGKFTGPTWACGFTIFLLQLTLELSSFLLFSIALNLQLVVVHKINGQAMEKYYVLGSWVMSLGLTVPAYASKQYGWDPLVKDCWYSNPDTKARLAWQIGTQLFWTLLTVVGELFTASTVVIFMVRYQLRKARAQSAAVTESRTRSRSGSVVVTNDPIAYANKRIIFRIVLYPIASALINLTSVACVIHATQNDGVHNWTGYRVLLLSDFVYGGRAVLYALLSATDPALVRAVQAFIQHARGISPDATFASGVRSTNDHGPTGSKDHPLSVHIELATIYQDDDGEILRMKSPTSPGGYSAHSETLRPPRDMEAKPRHDSVGAQSSTRSERGSRIQEHGIRQRTETLARDRERQEFQKQI
ncbi:hypothetical protein B0H16DRAFT_1829930 [Mycena metata]|uniref:G-protein coupled receptors family 2 profile 2 domain-containing protein n=1 Tax=Mycena metata TaxID=1033252 RepID=A0AAD7NXU4_9AGAR|nr:hypothetical protein B0H16DRAFT_1829930 [Mycena metata]